MIVPTSSPITGAAAINSFDGWLRNHLLPALILVVGSVLLVRLIHWGAHLWEADVDRRIHEAVDRDDVASEQLKRTRAMVQATSWALTALVVVVVASLSITVLGIPLTTLIAPATVAGVAVGFGAQQVVGDLLAGFFLLAEHQFGYGDVIRYGPPGEEGGVRGTVEEMTLRVTKLRTVQGELVIIPNGSLRQVTNLSKEWSRAVVDLPIATNADIERATAVLREAADADGRRRAVVDAVARGDHRVGHRELRTGLRARPCDGSNAARAPVRGGTRTAVPAGAGAQRGRHRHPHRPDERTGAAVTHGFVSWVSGPVAPRLPVRRSTVLLVVVFIGLVALYFSVRTEKIDYRGGLFDVTERDDGVRPSGAPARGLRDVVEPGGAEPVEVADLDAVAVGVGDLVGRVGPAG